MATKSLLAASCTSPVISNSSCSSTSCFLPKICVQFSEKSNNYYQNLEKIATNNSIKREAIIRLMLGFENKANQQSDLYAGKVLALDKIDDGLKNRASVILARSYFNQGNFQKAEKTFSILSRNTTDRVGAEATYMMAYLNYLNDSLQTAETTIYQLANDFTSDYWIAKGFILLSDIYKQRGNVAIYGGRRIGKTVELKYGPPTETLVFVNISIIIG